MPDDVCGQPASKTDWNGIVETFTYDRYCRPYNYTNSGTGEYIQTRFINEGNPAVQSIATLEALSSSTGSKVTSRLYDCLGCQWRLEMPAIPPADRPMPWTHFTMRVVMSPTRAFPGSAIRHGCGRSTAVT